MTGAGDVAEARLAQPEPSLRPQLRGSRIYDRNLQEGAAELLLWVLRRRTAEEGLRNRRGYYAGPTLGNPRGGTFLEFHAAGYFDEPYGLTRRERK